MATTSVTLRIPDEILKQIPQERGERSRAIVDLLQKGLSLPTGDETLSKMEETISVLNKKLGSQKGELQSFKDNVLQRLNALESPLKPPSQKKQPAQTLEKSEQNELFTSVTTPETKTEGKKNGLEKKQRMTSSELLKILRKEDSSKTWGPNDIARFRRKANSNKWHTVGTCKFQDAKEQETTKKAGKKQYLFWVVYPFRGEDLAS